MKLWKKAVMPLAFSLALLLFGCPNPEQQKSSQTTSQQAPQLKNELAKNTYVLDSSQLASMISISSNRITFSRNVNYSSGDILDIDSCSKAPFGDLVKVDSVSGNTIKTEPATIDEAVKNADYSVDFSINAASTNKSERDLSSTIRIPFNNLVVYDVDGKTSTPADEVVANGGFSLDLSGHLDINIKKFQMQKFTLECMGHDRLGLNLDSRISDPNFHKKDIIATYDKIPAIRILLPTVPPFPIIIRPELDAFIGIDGSLNAESGARLDQESYFTLGLSYEGKKWTPIKSFTNSFDFNPPSVSSLDLKVYAGADANFLLYDSAGVYLGPDAYFKFVSESNSLDLYKGLEAILGVDVKFLGKTLADYHKQIPVYEKLVKSFPINGGGGNNINTKTIDIRPGHKGKDTYFKKGTYASTGSSFYENGGNDPYLEVDNYNRKDGFVTAQSFIEFPLNSIPVGSVIDSAKLELFGTQNSFFSNTILDINKIAGPWNEQFSGTGPSWDNNPTDSFYLTGNAQEYKFDITSIVRGWMNGDPNYGVVLRSNGRTNGDFFTRPYSFYSGDYAADPDLRPTLEVTYETRN